MTALVDRLTRLARVRADLPQLRRRPTRSARSTPASSVSARSRSATTPAALARVTRADIEAGPHSLWRYAGLLPVGQDAATRVDSRHRHDAADPRRPARRRARLHRAGVGQGRLGQPDALVQGPRRVGRDHRRARARLRAHRVRVDRQPGQLGGRARGAHRHAVDRVRAGRPRAAEDRPERDLRRHAGRHRGLLRRRQPAVLASCRRRTSSRTPAS